MIAFFDPNEIQSFSGWIDRVIEDAALYVPSSPGFIGELSEGFVRSVAFQL
jgi:hypothetical protein